MATGPGGRHPSLRIVPIARAYTVFMKLTAFALALGLAACAQDAGRGAERQPCRAGNACDTGLTCLSDRCVRPPPADCAAVGAHVASFKLGNYATPEERAPAVAEAQAACERARVSKEQGVCLLAARDRWSAATCAPAMFPDVDLKDGSCDAIGEKIGEMIFRADPSASSDKTALQHRVIGAIVDSCREDGWPEKLRACMVAAPPTDQGMKSCEPLMPKDLQDKVSARMSKVM